MGWDTVSFSLKNTYQNNTIYNTWLNRVKNGNIKDFKEYLLSSDENLQLFAKHFDNYQEGDMFVKESIVELADGRLLCFDADQAQAYLIDLKNIDKNSDRICMSVFKPNDTTLSYDKQIENIIKQIKVKVGEDKFKTKDGTKLDIEYITSNLLQSTSLSLYQEAKGITTDSQTGETTTTIDTKNLNKIYYKNLSQITNEEEEKEYYQTLLESLGVSIDNEANIVDGSNVIQNINKTISEISKNLNPSTLTLANQNRLNLIEIVRKLSLSEITLIEKLNPGLLSTIGDFIGSYKGIVYSDKYGNTSSLSQSMSWADLMKEKADMQDDPLAYLRYEDRPQTKSSGTTIKAMVGDVEYSVNLAQEGTKSSTSTIDDVTYTFDKDGKMSTASFTAANGITYKYNSTGALISVSGEKASAANRLASNQVDLAKPAIEVLSYIENTQAQGVSDSTIEAYLSDFKKHFGTFPPNSVSDVTSPDGALKFLAELRNPEIAFKLLSDSDVQKAIKFLGEAKGTLAGGQGQTPEMYYYGVDGRIGVDSSGNLQLIKQELTIGNVSQHLSILLEMYKSSRYDEEGNYIAGDEERIGDRESIGSIESLLRGITEGKNVEYTTNNNAAQYWGMGISGTAMVGSALTGGIMVHNATTGAVLSGTKLTGKAAARLAWKEGASKLTGKVGLKGIGATGGAVIVSGAVVGGFVGNYIGDKIIQYDTSGDFVDENGNFCESKATKFKWGTTFSGIGAGTALGAGAALALGLVSNPFGWSILAAGAVVGVVSGVASWLHKKFGKKQ